MIFSISDEDFDLSVEIPSEKENEDPIIKILDPTFARIPSSPDEASNLDPTFSKNRDKKTPPKQRRRRRGERNWRRIFERPIRRDQESGKILPDYQRRKGRNPGIDQELSP